MSVPPPSSSTSIETLSNSQDTDETVIIALILAAGAFVISFLQFVYQYITSGTREKCLTGRIGDWAVFTKTSWDFSQWRLRVRYPQIDLSVANVLDTRRQFLNDNRRPESLKTIQRYLATPGMPPTKWTDKAFYIYTPIFQSVRAP